MLAWQVARLMGTVENTSVPAENMNPSAGMLATVEVWDVTQPAVGQSEPCLNRSGCKPCRLAAWAPMAMEVGIS
jgi:hypothetical protein